MFVRVKSTPNSPRKSVQIVESKRLGRKVSQRIVQHVGIATNDRQLEELKKLAGSIIAELEAEKQPPLEGIEPRTGQEQGLSEAEGAVASGTMVDVTKLKDLDHVIEGPKEILGPLFRQLDLDLVFGTSDRGRGKTHMLEGCVIGRIVAPGSKCATARFLKDKMHIAASTDRIYRMMDSLAGQEERVKTLICDKTRALCGGKIALMLYDVTTLYFESFDEDEFRMRGFSKDNKIKETQVVLALACTGDGLPLWYKLFPGSTTEGVTLLTSLEDFAHRFGPEETILVADRGLFSKANLEKVQEKGFKYVVGARLKNMKKCVKERVLDRSDYVRCARPPYDGQVEKEGQISFELKVLEYEAKQNLVVSWSGSRADKDRHDREKLVERARKILNGQDAVSGEKLIKNRGTSRYLSPKDNEKKGEFVLNEDKIAEEARWDGIHGVITNISDLDVAKAQKILGHYHSLWHIEDCFRVQKHSLQVRPMFHWTEKRIRAHVSICYMAFAMCRYLQHRTKLQQKKEMSVERIRETLLDVQSAIIEDTVSGKKYRLPREMTEEAKKIYRAMGIRRTTVPTEILSMPKYHNRKGLSR